MLQPSVLVVHYTIFLWRKKTTCDAFNVMRPVNLWFFYLCVMKVQLQGILSGVSQAASCSACQYMTPSWLSVAHKLQPLTSAFCLLLLKIKIFFLLSFKKAVSPAAQQLCNKEVCQVMSDQTNDGWPTLHARFTQESAFLRRKSERGNLYLIKSLF